MNKIRGIATSGGVAFGPVRFVGAPSRQVVMNKAENPAQELVRAEWAREAAKQELEEMCSSPRAIMLLRTAGGPEMISKSWGMMPASRG